mgnify:CR=1 FL=1
MTKNTHGSATPIDAELVAPRRVVVHMEVDKSRRNDLAASIDHGLRLVGRQILTDLGHPRTLDRHIANPVDPLERVDHPTASDQYVPTHITAPSNNLVSTSFLAPEHASSFKASDFPTSTGIPTHQKRTLCEDIPQPLDHRLDLLIRHTLHPDSN